MSRSCWIITPGEAGFESQGRGLAEALDTVPVLKRVRVKRPWTWIPGAWWRDPLAALAEGSDPLAPPWPDLVVSSGRVTAPVAIAIKQASRGRTRIAHIQHPLMPLGKFDVVIAPRHDRVAGPNVVTTTGAIHCVTPEKLAAAAERWRDRFAALPRPLVGVLIGGSNGRFKLDPVITGRLADQLRALTHRRGAGLAITPSRRTGAENETILRERLADVTAFVWDRAGDNPYFGILALADVLVVTEDSVSMTSEALSTGKPVYVAPLPGRSRRIRRFQDALAAEGLTRPFDGELAAWTYAPPDDTRRAAAECRRRFGWS